MRDRRKGDNSYFIVAIVNANLVVNRRENHLDDKILMREVKVEI